MRFRVYYADGSTHDGDTQDFETVKTAPAARVLLVKTEAENENGWAIRHGCAIYGWCRLVKSDGSWEGEYYWSGMDDLIGLANYCYTMQNDFHKILLGIEVPDKTFQEIKQNAIMDGCLCVGECDHVKRG